MAEPNEERRRARGWLVPAAIVALALLLRIGAVAVDTGFKPENDSFIYDYYARSVADGNGYPQSGFLRYGGPSAFRGPGYPYFLGGIYAAAGHSVTAGRLAGVALGALAVLLLYALTRRIWGRRVGLVAAAFAAIFPPFLVLSQELWSESLFLVLELAALLLVVEFRRSGGLLRWAAAAGALCGLAALTRDLGVVVLAAVALGLWTMRPRLRPRSLAAPALAIGCAALVILPWTVRNANQFGRFIPLTTSAGVSAAGVYNQESYTDGDSHGGWRFTQVVPEYAQLFVTPGLDEADVDSTLIHDVRRFAWEHPGYVVEASAWNLLRLFEFAGGSVVDRHGTPVDPPDSGAGRPLAERIGILLAAVLGIVGVGAIVRSWAKRRSREGAAPRIPRGPLYLWLVPVLMLVTTAPIGGLPRYRLPIDPFLIILASIGAVWLWDRTLRHSGEPA